MLSPNEFIDQPSTKFGSYIIAFVFESAHKDNWFILTLLLRLLIEIFLLKTLKLLVEGSKLIISKSSCTLAAYKEYNPMFAPISQKTVLFFLSNLSIHSSVSGSLEKRVSTLHLAVLFGTKNFTSFFLF